ncbi:MAG: Lrp/AsnC family transcriptional regulator [Candidatus Bathyarchaeota archaeon]|nr:Lrp/AsnC family transcriptional regulator [Candidatus Bathyarchaeota archaeon]
MPSNNKIDEIDARILQRLLLESRTTFTDIAHECDITVGAVRMRYKRLWREGIINGEVMLVNPHCLGYRHIIDLGIFTKAADEQEVLAYLDTKPYISDVIKHMGKYTYFGKTALKDLNQLSKIVEDLEENSKIIRVEPLIWAEAVNVEFPHNLIIKPLKHKTEPARSQRPASTDLDKAFTDFDEIDLKIATVLSRQSRTPFRQIASDLGLSTKTVIQRYNRLRKNLLTLSSATLDLSKLGYEALINLYVTVNNRSKLNEIYSSLLKLPNVIVIIRLIGNYDLYIGLVVADFGELFATRAEIKKIPGMETVEAFVVPAPKSWPLNLFSSLLEGNVMRPKHWTVNSNIKQANPP